MADEADIANDYHELLISRALNKMVRQESSVKAGPKNCAECEEAIPLARRKLGFNMCVQCAQETERRKAQFANY